MTGSAKENNISKTKFQKTAAWVLFPAVIAFMAAMLLLQFSKTKDGTAGQAPQPLQETLEEIISPEAAVAKIRELDEVKSYLKNVPNALVDLESVDEETNTYLVHVYEIKNGHTATFNWYTVNKKTGEITAEFDFEEGAE